MDMTPFTATPCAARRDGWSPERKLRFLDHLAARGNVRAACGAVGMTREAAYALRRRDALFARGWAAALLLAREAGAEALADKALDGIEEEVWHRGELMGTRRRFDARLLLAHVARLDRIAERADARATADAERFDEILARVAGVEIPEELRVPGQPLPLDRESALDMAADEAAADVDEARSAREAESEDGLPSDEHDAAHQAERAAAAAEARAEAGARWDHWFAGACAAVDGLLGRSGADEASADSSPSTVSEVSESPRSAAATAIGPDGRLYAYA